MNKLDNKILEKNCDKKRKSNDRLNNDYAIDGIEDDYSKFKEEKSQIKYDIDPIFDYNLKTQYQTKFRISSEEKIKKKVEIKSKLSEINNKLKLIGKESTDVFEEESSDKINKPITNRKSSKRFEEESDNESLCDESLELETDTIENTIENENNKHNVLKNSKDKKERKSSNNSNDNVIVTPQKNIDTLIESDSNKLKNLNIKNIKDSLDKKVIKSNTSPNIIKTKEHLFKDDVLDDSSISITDKDDEEDSSDNKIIKNLLNQSESSNKDKSTESDDIIQNDEYEQNEDNEEYEEIEDDEEYQEIDDNEEYDEFDDEESYEIEDGDGDDLFDLVSSKKFNQQQLSYFQNIFNPPDFKKDLLNKSPGEKNNEVNYQSLKDALKNSTINMKNLKKMKNEVYHNKTNEFLLGKKNKLDKSSEKNGDKKFPKIKISTHDNVIFKFDKSKSILMMNPKYPRDYRVDNTKVPLKSCLKKNN